LENILPITNIVFDKLADSLATKTVAECGPAARQHRTKGSKNKKRKANDNSTGTASAQSGSKKARVEDAEDISEPSPPLDSSSATTLKAKVQDIFIIYVPY